MPKHQPRNLGPTLARVMREANNDVYLAAIILAENIVDLDARVNDLEDRLRMCDERVDAIEDSQAGRARVTDIFQKRMAL